MTDQSEPKLKWIAGVIVTSIIFIAVVVIFSTYLFSSFPNTSLNLYLFLLEK